MTIELILFDCDGTLVDSEEICNRGLVDRLKPFGLNLNPDEMVRKYRGGQLAKILDSISKTYKVELPEDFVERYREYLSELYKSDLKPISGVEDALKKLNFPMGVVSNGPKSKVNLALKVCGLSSYFETHVFSAYDVQAWKPDPKVYLYAAAQMGYSPENCLVVEDGLVGVEAGMKVFFFNRHKGSNIFEDQGVIEFDSMDELPKLVTNLI